MTKEFYRCGHHMGREGEGRGERWRWEMGGGEGAEWVVFKQRRDLRWSVRVPSMNMNIYSYTHI